MDQLNQEPIYVMMVTVDKKMAENRNTARKRSAGPAERSFCQILEETFGKDRSREDPEGKTGIRGEDPCRDRL